MKNKGFTLIELLSVIVLLALTLLIVIPTVINFIKTADKDKEEYSNKLILTAAENYVKDYAKYLQINETNICVSLKTLSELNYLPKSIDNLDEPIIDSKSVDIKYLDGYLYNIVNNEDCYSNGLIPISHNGEEWIIADVNNAWYDYDNQNWANAIILNDNVKKNIGDVVDINSEVKAMFVWIPRYEYKIEDSENEIKVNFISKNKEVSSEGYIIHPAFKFGDKQLSGIWVGKFETSHITLSLNDNENNLNCNGENCLSANGLRILPNVVSLRNNNISNIYYAVRSMSSENNTFKLDSSSVDTHMMKNDEWGAVAYLSKSEYGKYGNSIYEGVNKEIYQNKSDENKTGYSNGTPSQEEVNEQCRYNSIIDRLDGTGACGSGASTTGNITGIYDMSGGALEYVMGYYEPAFECSSKWGGTCDEDLTNFAGFTSIPNLNYYNIYKEETMYYGHALTETSGWYNDNSLYLNDRAPWFMRGGSYNTNENAGIFAYYQGRGNAGPGGTFRVVLVSVNK